MERMHLGTGIAWAAMPRHLTSVDVMEARPKAVISCVDSREARASVHEAVTHPRSRVCYWLDLGNRLHHGQVELGCPLNAVNRRSSTRLDAEGSSVPSRPAMRRVLKLSLMTLAWLAPCAPARSRP